MSSPHGESERFPHGQPDRWSRLIESVGPAALLIIIESRMGAPLRARVNAEDILQEALLMAWRDRASHQWRGVRVFRAWLLSIIDHRIADARDHSGALKRGGAIPHLPIGPQDSAHPGPEPWLSTTPSRIASLREESAAMQAALDSLPEDVRAVVRLRLVEQLQIEQIAIQMGIGESAVRHRFRRGAELFRYRMTSHLGTRAGRTTGPVAGSDASDTGDCATVSGPPSSTS